MQDSRCYVVTSRMSARCQLQAIIPETLSKRLCRAMSTVLLIAMLTVSPFSPRLRAEITQAVSLAGKVFFGIIRIIVKAAPIGAFGASPSLSSLHLASLASLAKLIDLLPH